MPVRPKTSQPLSYMGIDPGQKGGIAVLYATETYAWPMPSTERDVWDRIRLYDQGIALIEAVHSMPGQGVSSTFKFGAGYGGLRMALIAAGIPFEQVQPRTWQKAFGIPARAKTETKDQFKNRLKAKAQQLFPRVEVTLSTADALLIALYCMRKHTGTL